MDALEVRNLNFERVDSGIFSQSDGHVSDDIFDESRIFISLHCDEALIRSLQKWIERGRSRCFSDLKEFLDPKLGKLTFGSGQVNVHLYQTSLIVSAVVADRLTARAKTRHWNFHYQVEALTARTAFSVKGRLTIDPTFQTAHWGRLFDEVREGHRHLSCRSFQLQLEVVKNLRDRGHSDLAAIAVDHGDESTHVRPLDLRGERDRKRYIGDSLLSSVRAVQDRDRILEIADPHLVETDHPLISCLLNVYQFHYTFLFVAPKIREREPTGPVENRLSVVDLVHFPPPIYLGAFDEKPTQTRRQLDMTSEGQGFRSLLRAERRRERIPRVAPPMPSVFKPKALRFYVPWRNRSLPLDWDAEFGRSAPLKLEIGFGNGEFLARCASDDPTHNYIGVEMTWGSIKRACQISHRMNLNNVRLLWEDARAALAWDFSERSLQSITALYPCPWPKTKHAKFRLFQPSFLKLCNSRLADGGTLTVVTDSAPYRDEILSTNTLEATGMRSSLETIPASFKTKYEKKWQETGQTEFYRLTFEKVSHLPIPKPEVQPVKHHVVPYFDPENFHPQDERVPYSVQFKQFLFDAKQQIGLLEVHAHEENIEQHFYIRIKKQHNGWKVHPAAGPSLLPVPSVQRALDLVASHFAPQPS